MIRNSINAYSAYRRKQPKQDDKPGWQQKPAGWGTPEAWQNAWNQANPGQTLTPPAPPAPEPPPATPQSTPGLRPDSLYDLSLSNLNAQEANTNLGLTNQLNQAGIQSGIKFDTDPNGLATNFQIDYSNPFSQASLLKTAYDQRTRGNSNSYASSGQLYSGALQRQQNATTTDWQQGEHNLLSGFGGLAAQIFQQRLNARNETLAGSTEASNDLLGRQIEAGPQPMPGMSGADQLNALGGTLVIKNGQRYIRKPDGGLYDFNGNRVG